MKAGTSLHPPRLVLPLGGYVRRPRPLLAVASAAAPSPQPEASPAAQSPRPGRISFLQSLGLVQNPRTAVPREAMGELARRTVEQAVKNDALEELELQQKAQLPPPDLRSYLAPVGTLEAGYTRMLSSLSSQCYELKRLTPSRLRRLHHLTLVTTSLACDAGLRSSSVPTAAEVLSEGDAMAADPRLVANLLPAKPAGEDSTVLVANMGNSLGSAVPASTEATSAGSSGGLATAAASVAAPLANNILSFSHSLSSSATSMASSLPPVRLVAAQLERAAAAGHSTAVTTIAAVSAALDAAWGGSARVPKECQSPTEWYVCDDEATKTRYFVIQGSDNLDHWRVNLTFDPVVFEDKELGVKVHRGVYETAQILYDRFLPLIRDHQAASPFARFAFTGHSLGGSLGTLLMLMYVRRGVLDKSRLAPTYTFGSPAIFCEGASGRCAGSACGGCSSQERMGEGSSGRGVLAALGLPEGAVRNVVMHKDIVPRAFACDYSSLADLLRRVSSSFREHTCLNGQRQVMFNFIGQILVLQPDAAQTFVAGEGYHPMLPQAPGFFLVREPSVLHAVRSVAQRDVALVGRALQQAAGVITSSGSSSASVDQASQQQSASTDSGGSAPDPSCVIGSRAGPGFGPAPHSARDALFELMNNPHPLDILSDSAAYGSAGRVSRYHNPNNYTKAIGSVLRARGPVLQRLAHTASSARQLRWHAPMEQAAGTTAQVAAAAGGAAPARGGKLRHLHTAQRRMLQRYAEAQLNEGSY